MALVRSVVVGRVVPVVLVVVPDVVVATLGDVVGTAVVGVPALLAVEGVVAGATEQGIAAAPPARTWLTGPKVQGSPEELAAVEAELGVV